ncbi:endoglucanase [Marichromatium bheemlicum]|uniref:Endoglucanase n=1 Tax=Marichromatium bheemlicum TaxID=365339 RepID=A0ABX1I5T6_9GAMM|nr:endoglucanase [Marichromatium bheemlicum]NKN32536.1 endoglucanase [Marichromatium bheemlicum]
MQISNATLHPLYPLPLEQPQRERDPQATPEQLQPRADQAERIPRPVAEVERAERLQARKESRELLAANANIDPRARRALDEYQAVQQHQERVYVQQVLGVDVYA